MCYRKKFIQNSMLVGIAWKVKNFNLNQHFTITVYSYYSKDVNKYTPAYCIVCRLCSTMIDKQFYRKLTNLWTIVILFHYLLMKTCLKNREFFFILNFRLLSLTIPMRCFEFSVTNYIVSSWKYKQNVTN